jgi:hypothetical protein
VQPERASSASAVWVETRIASGVSRAQMGYRVVNQLNRLAFCAAGTARVRVW